MRMRLAPPRASVLVDRRRPCSKGGEPRPTNDYEAEPSRRDDYGRAPATSEAHNYTLMREAESPLDQVAAMRFEVVAQHHEGTVQ
eukprot:249951-Pleurochrysis_carterae.AAC.1